MTSQNFRDYLMPNDAERIGLARGVDLHTYGARMLATEKAQKLKAHWQAMLDETFRGITANGEVQSGLFSLQDEGFAVEEAVRAAQALFASLDSARQQQVSYAIDAPQWRAWYNPEIPFNDYGVRLDETSAATHEAFWSLLRSCTSAAGFSRVQQVMDANHFLGELYDLTHIMNRWSFHFLLFGSPSATQPWGWSIYGHHVAFCCFIVGRQLVIAPTFFGVEPNVIERGDASDCVLFRDEEQLGLALMQSLSARQQHRATIYQLMEDPAMPADRFNFADQRHLGGAFQDNRVIPLEGVCVAEFTPAQRQQVMALVAVFLAFLPDGPRAARLQQIEAQLDNTWWSWIGGCGDDDVFYYRLQSPVVMLEFDHHSGMWLTNEEPARFHIHTITRIPNGNDYGKALLSQLQQ
ncbi:hypothetical protein L579_3557 [Pantoea sp. AS-PWVM4]|uniref:DUF3500 domain-containing protein n=1 Tax=Pantoea sp. AS-PWVM4 TaxID=1332069 RepID=UPI0003AC83F5|nr:DUF3500 domain-containing protein [Pantoea sp. AS-PWVM4]ERK17676.1 hypothetical protein L579_3557 [Pantoea sp. AS-PWVM4]